MPTIQVSGTNAVLTFLMLTVIYGALHLLAAAHPDNQLAKSWVALGF